MLRKKSTDKIEPMPKRQFQKIVKSFKRQGGEIRTDEEAQGYLDFRHADGITLSENLIFLRRNPTRSAVFEELIHSAQFRNGEIKKLPKDSVLAEINAKKKLLKYQKQYQLTQREIEDTERALQEYMAELEILDGGKDEI